MSARSRRLTVVVTLCAAVGLIATATATATYVKGHQIPVNASGTKYKMTGGLKGKWKILKFHVKHTKPVFKAKGLEKFNGCVDLARDGSCAGDPAGQLLFRFRFWAAIENGEVELLGTCAHRIVASSGGLTGTTGFLMMVDTPIKTAPGLKTHYEGDVVLPGIGRPTAARPPRC
jgi:hypothetical protein